MKFDKALNITELDEAKKEKKLRDKLSGDPATLTKPDNLKKGKKKAN